MVVVVAGRVLSCSNHRISTTGHCRRSCTLSLNSNIPCSEPANLNTCMLAGVPSNLVHSRRNDLQSQPVRTPANPCSADTTLTNDVLERRTPATLTLSRCLPSQKPVCGSWSPIPVPVCNIPHHHHSRKSEITVRHSVREFRDAWVGRPGTTETYLGCFIAETASGGCQAR